MAGRYEVVRREITRGQLQLSATDPSRTAGSAGGDRRRREWHDAHATRLSLGQLRVPEQRLAQRHERLLVPHVSIQIRWRGRQSTSARRRPAQTGADTRPSATAPDDATNGIRAACEDARL